MNTIYISVVISAHNEENKIKECLDSIKDFADEIIFLDNSSTDRTAEIASNYTSKIFSRKNDSSNIDLQKNFGIEKATGKWIMVLDADERLTKELADEITKKIQAKSSDQISGFLIPRKNIIFGKWIRHSGWYPDLQPRLFKNGKGKYFKKHVHEPIQIEGNVAKLDNFLIHYNYESIAQFLTKHLLIYAPNEAEELINKGYNFEWQGIIRLPLNEFLSRYFFREGYKDGFHGLALSLLMSVYYLAIFLYIWESKKFIDKDSKNISLDFTKEVSRSSKDLQYWLDAKSFNSEKNIFKKTAKIIKKLKV
jgi:glycosyltransferase involved in cell wall biosynthesis